MAAPYLVLTFDSGVAGYQRVPVDLSRSLTLARAPVDCVLTVRIDSATADAIPMASGESWGFPGGFSLLVLEWAASAIGGDIVFIVSPSLGGAASVSAGKQGVAAGDGDIAALGATTSAAVTDPTAAATVVAALKGLLALSGGRTGPPFIASQACALADPTTYDVAVAAALGRHAHAGSIRAAAGNAGVLSFAVSSGAGYSGFYPLAAGEAYDLDGMDVATIRVKSTAAADVAVIEAH